MIDTLGKLVVIYSRRITMPEENWDDQADYLRRSRFLYENDDYFEFLVTRVWKLDKPCRIIDFGCGLGYMGTKLLPLLPEGSTYIGIDKSGTLLEEAEKIFAGQPWEYRFVESEVYTTPFDDSSFDLTVSHAVLMHLERAEDALKEMVRVTRNGGMVITCDANRNAFSTMFYTDGINMHERVPLTLGQQMNRDIREKTGVDYNIGIKTPALMDNLGLKNTGCRISDCVTYLMPSMDIDKRQRLHEILCGEGLALPENFEEIRQEWTDRLLGFGVRMEDIEKQARNEIDMDFRNRGQEYHTAFPGLMTWSYGTVEKGNK